MHVLFKQTLPLVPRESPSPVWSSQQKGGEGTFILAYLTCIMTIDFGLQLVAIS